MNRYLVEGDEVFLSENTKWNTKSEANPLNCKGIVDEIDGVIYVNWSNGTTNSYHINDSDLVKIG